ncbi:MAG: LytTR family transcriptional regulator DNA-binding domain-containing protein [Ruminococcus sp.]|nr:LytTR family transcriptional regulator DNA-binding domain-containing protein [Ruminococcus sp.]
MITMLICSTNARELQFILSKCKRLGELCSDERWNYVTCTDENTLTEALNKCECYDIACIDLTLKNGLETAQRLRRVNPAAHIMVIANKNISPLEYVRPSVVPAGLMLRPLNGKTLAESLEENLSAYLKSFYGDNSVASFAIDNKEGRRLIPYTQIMYFEAREKKISLFTLNREYSFYDTLDNLSEMLPDNFIRCHRGFIVNREKISQIMLSQNTIILTNGGMIPTSRTYRAVVKELK